MPYDPNSPPLPPLNDGYPDDWHVPPSAQDDSFPDDWHVPPSAQAQRRQSGLHRVARAAWLDCGLLVTARGGSPAYGSLDAADFPRRV